MKTAKYGLSRSSVLLGLLLAVLAAWGGYLSMKDPRGIRGLPFIQTSPDGLIVGLEIPVRGQTGEKGDAVLKAAFARRLNDHEIHVYGGFSFDTPQRYIEGEEAVINLRTASAHDMKNVRIWDKR